MCYREAGEKEKESVRQALLFFDYCYFYWPRYYYPAGGSAEEESLGIEAVSCCLLQQFENCKGKGSLE